MGQTVRGGGGLLLLCLHSFTCIYGVTSVSTNAATTAVMLTSVPQNSQSHHGLVWQQDLKLCTDRHLYLGGYIQVTSIDLITDMTSEALIDHVSHFFLKTG